VNCYCDIALHIADFCTQQENVIPYCHRCTRKIEKGKINPPKNCKVFDDEVNSTCDGGIQGIKLGDKVKIYCKDKNAYGIHLN
jgi:hypothetical protein